MSVGGSGKYDTNYNLVRVEVRGYKVSKIVADKLRVLATSNILRRVKDFVDIYRISLGSNILKLEDINEYLRDWELRTDSELGDYYTYLIERDRLFKTFSRQSTFQYSLYSHTKEELFDYMYQRVLDFITPFLPSNREKFKDLVWNTNTGTWQKGGME